MIALAQMRALLEARRGALVDTEGKQHFQNTPYPLSRLPLLVEAAAVDRARAQVERYVRLLEWVIRDYRASAETRAWFGFPEWSERLSLAHPEERVRVCRLDGYVAASTQALRVLENNADAPAGTLFTPQLNRFTRALWGEVAPARLPMEGEGDPFIELIVRASGVARPRIVVLQPTGRSNNECMQLVALMRARGLDAELADPRALGASPEGFSLGGRPIDVIWNKINALSWGRVIAEAPELVGRWAPALATGRTAHLNGFTARAVVESKMALAFVQRDAVRARLPEALRPALELLPRARRLAPGEVLEDALAEREQRVLKEVYDIRGDGVTVGRAVSQAEWAARLEAALGTGAIVQDHVEPTRAPVLFEDGREALLRHSLDWFVFDGEVVGLGSKANAGHKVNLFQGGTKLSVVQVEG